MQKKGTNYTNSYGSLSTSKYLGRQNPCNKKEIYLHENEILLAPIIVVTVYKEKISQSSSCVTNVSMDECA